jgi:hypothetical protein
VIGGFHAQASAGDISVRQAWSRATPKGAQVARGYLRIENHGIAPDKLLSASTALAGKIEIHEMTMLDGIMMMRLIDNGLVIPAGETITLAPGGHHRSIEECYFRCAANMSSQLMGLGGSLRSTTEVVTAPNRPIASTIIASLSGVGTVTLRTKQSSPVTR